MLHWQSFIFYTLHVCLLNMCVNYFLQLLYLYTVFLILFCAILLNAYNLKYVLILVFVDFRTWRWMVPIIRSRIYQEHPQYVMEKPQTVTGKKIGTPVLTLEMQPLTQDELDLSFILRYDLVNKIILKYFNYHTLFYFYDLASSAFKSIIHAQCRM